MSELSKMSENLFLFSAIQFFIIDAQNPKQHKHNSVGSYSTTIYPSQGFKNSSKYCVRLFVALDFTFYRAPIIPLFPFSKGPLLLQEHSKLKEQLNNEYCC